MWGLLVPPALGGLLGQLARGATSGLKDRWGLDSSGAWVGRAETDRRALQGLLGERGPLGALDRRGPPGLGPPESQAAWAQSAPLDLPGREAKWG